MSELPALSSLQVQAQRYLKCETTEVSQAEEKYTKASFDARLVYDF
jgi:hypothetical protein